MACRGARRHGGDRALAPCRSRRAVMIGRRASAPALLAVMAYLFAGPASIGVAAAAPDTHPYFAADGPLDFAARAARSRSLGAAAAAGGDTARQARHLAMACLFETLGSND